MQHTREEVMAFLEHDTVTTGLGMEVVEVGEGHAVLRMVVRPDMLNGFEITHGGILFTLADSCFALACNNLEDSSVVVAQHAEIDFLRPTRVGDVLIATAEQRHQARRSGIYDVHIDTADGTPVATFRGRCRTQTQRPPQPAAPADAQTDAPQTSSEGA